MHEVDVIASGSIHDAMQMHKCCCSTSSSHFTTPITTISLLQEHEQEEPELELEAVKMLFHFFRISLKKNGEFSPHKKSLTWKEDVETLAMTPMKF